MKKYIFDKKYLPHRMLAGFILGIVFGAIFTDISLTIKPLGTLFMDLIKMLIVPVIFFSVTSGIAAIGDVHKLKRVGSKVVLVYTVMTIFAAILGIIVAAIIRPGKGFTMEGASNFDASNVTTPDFLAFFFEMVPTNIVEAMSTGNVMQIIFFSFIFGIALVLLGEKANLVTKFVDQSANVIYRMLDIVMIYAPIGVFALMANTVAEYGSQLFGAMFKFIAAVWIGDLFIWIILSVFAALYSGVKYSYLCKSMLPIWANTMATTSSAGTIPITMDVTTKKLGIPHSIASFSIPLGATINLTGAALWKTVLAVFVADMYSISFTPAQFVLIVLISTIMSIAAPGIPGGGIVTGAIFLNLLGLPLELMGLIVGMYRLLDMANTTVNVSGDVLGTMIVAKNEKLWNPKKIDFDKEAQYEASK
ncbi:dicarboxylate/amino acid:cation symporter [Bacillus sp. JJ1532]|uniref:dicarboxylate/amino acid:cation symporter n=1 Tax=unclassified Bacillus (in: firmicutes) TaxID=185979 RepID=UPI002FFF7B82